LEIEMDKLERYWEENELPGVETFEMGSGFCEERDLKERLNYLREAAEIAKRNRAVLLVG